MPPGVPRDVQPPTYADLVRGRVARAVAAAGGPADDAIATMLAGRDTWTVGE
ncbi:MAG: hypothetical protein H7231_12915 [Rhodoferax sp.]|nr:hypothetical protein [Actinomycetota bacterium]